MLNQKHLKVRLAQCHLISTNSPCPRKKVGAVIIDPLTNVVLSDGYNGTPRGSKNALCGGSVCLRTCQSIPSGSQNDVGCHHAEMNAIANASRVGSAPLMGAWLFINCDPCLMCAKFIHHAGIVRVYAPFKKDSTRTNGLEYLIENNVEVIPTSSLDVGA
jgi:dCMP deaminase